MLIIKAKAQLSALLASRPHTWPLVECFISHKQEQEQGIDLTVLSRLTVVSCEAKKKQAVRNKRESYLHVAPL